MTQKISITAKYLHISPQKLLKKVESIKKKKLLGILSLNSNIRLEEPIAKLISRAKNCLKNIHNISYSNVLIENIFVNKGSISKRFQPRAKGKAYKIEKKSSHLTLCLSYNSSQTIV